jgi:hypothetical protein
MFILKNKVGIIFQNTFIGKLRVFVYLFVWLLMLTLINYTTVAPNGLY